MPQLIVILPNSGSTNGHMARVLTKQTKQDFQNRVKRVDPQFHRMGEAAYASDKTPRRRTVSVLMGFGWVYLVTAIATNRDHIEASLRQGSLPATYHDHIFMGLTVLLAASCVLLCLHVFRYFFRSGNRSRNSGGILVGAMGALAVFYTPAHVWTAGYGMMDGNSQNFLLTASAALEETFPGINVDSMTYVLSSNR